MAYWVYWSKYRWCNVATLGGLLRLTEKFQWGLKLIRENFASLKKVLIFAPDLETNQMVDVAQLVRVEDCGS